MPKAKRKQHLKNTGSIADTEQLEAMLKQAESELNVLQPRIDNLEAKLQTLKELKQQKQKLITLKLSLKSILNNFSDASKSDIVTKIAEIDVSQAVREKLKKDAQPSQGYFKGSFLPDVAFEKAAHLFKRKNSLNLEFFRAIVFSGGQASTEDIRRYLVENRIAMPGTGQFFDEVPLTEISSRVNYLLRKGLVASAGRGKFVSTLGWDNADT